MESIYTLDEVSKHLKVPVEAIEKEIETGRLEALNVAGHLRISEHALAEFKRAAVTNSVAKNEGKRVAAPAATQWLRLQPAGNFVHRWPDGKVEEYNDVKEGIAVDQGHQYHVRLGWTVRKSGGKDRQRWLVIVDRYPTVEFVKCSDETGGAELVASIIRDARGKQIPALATLPPEYEEFQTGVYSEMVKGPRNSSGQAVVCAANDFPTMVRHALIRTRYRDRRK